MFMLSAFPFRNNRLCLPAALWQLASTLIPPSRSSGGASRLSAAMTMTNARDPRFRTWPITSAKALEPTLRGMGLELDAEDIDGTGGGGAGEGSALSDALVSVGTAGRGGTGSFVSPHGLIVTNWHVAHDAVRRASIDSSVDYVRDGFVARSPADEIEGPNYECWITEACADVSDRILEGVAAGGDGLDALGRANRIRDIRQEVAQAAQDAGEGGGDGGVRCDVVEMIPDKSYVLFTYKRLRDVRIAYVPPKSLGGFGGDVDNFEWPRHTADFTLLRAYVPPSSGGAGSWGGYHPDNVPYDSSKSFIRVRRPSDAADVKEGDMVFLLGFPGSTMRYAPTPRLRFADAVAVPHMVKDFTRKLQLIADHEGHSKEAALKLGSTKKGLANELKRSKGKLVMMRKLKLIDERSAEEADLMRATAAEDGKRAEGGRSVVDILDRLEEIYTSFEDDHEVSSALDSLRGIYGGSSLLAAGHSIHEYGAKEHVKPDSERETAYRRRNLPFLAKRLTKRLRDVHPPHEADLVSDCVSILEKLKSRGEADEVLGGCLRSIGKTILGDEETARNSVVGDHAASRLLSMCADPDIDLPSGIFVDDDSSLVQGWLEDPFVKVAAALWDAYERDRDASKSLISERDTLLAELLEYQKRNSDEEVYPDCNGSLRISAGFVEGYRASDAVMHTPMTTLAGLLDKATEAKLMASGREGDGNGDSVFNCPERLYEMLESDTTGDGPQKVPVCLLYSTDTVGGNSGSPVMNRRGELVAINFDRQRQGLMNEYKWSSRYSRSIGVDVRYILWLVGEYDGAKHLVEELISDD